MPLRSQRPGRRVEKNKSRNRPRRNANVRERFMADRCGSADTESDFYLLMLVRTGSVGA